MGGRRTPLPHPGREVALDACCQGHYLALDTQCCLPREVPHSKSHAAYIYGAADAMPPISSHQSIRYHERLLAKFGSPKPRKVGLGFSPGEP